MLGVFRTLLHVRAGAWEEYTVGGSSLDDGGGTLSGVGRRGGSFVGGPLLEATRTEETDETSLGEK